MLIENTTFLFAPNPPPLIGYDKTITSLSFGHWLLIIINSEEISIAYSTHTQQLT